MLCAIRQIATTDHFSGKKQAYRPIPVHAHLGRECFSHCDSLSPELTLFTEIKKGFSKNRQEDTHEFFRFVTDAFQNTELAGKPKYVWRYTNGSHTGTCPRRSSTRPGCTAPGVDEFDRVSSVCLVASRQIRSTHSWTCRLMYRNRQSLWQTCSRFSFTRTSWTARTSTVAKSGYLGTFHADP